MKFITFLLATLMYSNFANAISKTSGEVAIEHNIIHKDDDFKYKEDSSSSIFTRLSYKYKWNDQFRFISRGFARSTPSYHDNDVAVIEELYLDYRPTERWIFKLGHQLFNWSATEAFHPADVLNARNFRGYSGDEEKLGELMLNIERRIENGEISLFFIPKTTAPIYPGNSFFRNTDFSSLEFGKSIFVKEDNKALSSEWDGQYGANIKALLGDADVSVHYLDIYDRSTPLLHLDSSSEVRPIHLRMQQMGGTYQQAFGRHLVKLEAAHRNYSNFYTVRNPFTLASTPTTIEDNTQVAVGYEYGWNTDDGGDATFIVETLSVLGVDEVERQTNYIFQNDMLFGYRYAFNDEMGSEFLVTVIADLEREQEYVYGLRYEQRITGTWKFDMGINYVDAKKKDSVPLGLERLDGIHPIYFKLTSYF